MGTKKVIKKNSSKKKSTRLETVSEFIHFAAKKFSQSKIYFGHGTDNAWDEAVYIVLYALNLQAYKDQSALEKKLTVGEKEKVLKMIDRRIKKRVPAAYLIGKTQFAGLPFYVDKRALIPRSPLSELIENRFVPWINPKKVSRILDIGTGSGCIAIASACVFPNAKIDAIDVSSEALKIAAMNCIEHKVAKRVRLLKSNLFEKLKGQTYDIIISNPPYVGKSEMKSLPKEYHHEPKQALFAGKSGDEIVNRIIKDAGMHLSPKGILVVEVGNSATLIMQKYPHLPFVWLEFERGEGEVFLLTREQLLGLVTR